MTYSDEQVAWACHEFNRVLQAIHNDPVPSQPWDSESEETRASTAEGVCSVRRGRTPRQLHEDWAVFKRAHGWTWGRVKDPVKKTHPCLVENYEDLPPEELVKDQMFLLIVTGMTVGLLPDATIRAYQEHGQRTADQELRRPGPDRPAAAPRQAQVPQPQDP